ncbi:cytochrome P450 [Nocardia ninae]|uniref:Cytochrome P450 n=1 Tax=Nocardia ninae NBRC 108245 TaxID=1210091 RepID=A0A511MH86_9NOCA|nr:cytochrome P450 [Nocardia ninae]GEM39801.1 cytochrome P450 [Nocardia ninae NBRC 108245]
MRITVPRTADPDPDPDIDLAEVDLSDLDCFTSGDPHAIWAQLRRRAPAHRRQLPDGRAFWSITRYHDVRAVLRDHTRFTSSRGTLLSILGGTDPAGGKMMAASDPPVHTAMREPLSKALSPRELRSRVPQIRRITHQVLAPLLDGGVWDMAEAMAGFPMMFTGALMGIPEDDWPSLARLTTMAIAPQDPDFQQTAGHGTLAAAHHELFAYFAGLVMRRRRNPADDLIGFLLEMTADGRKLRHDELVYNCYSLLLGANVTTPHAVAATVLALIDHPAEYRRWTADPSLTPTAVEEGLRWASPTNHFLRYTVTDTTIGGQSIPAGEAVVAWLGSANRDDDVFADPFRFDLTRAPNPHVAFGYGPHYCIGAPLARIALRVLFEEITRVVESFSVAGPVEHLASTFTAGVKRLPLRAQLFPNARFPDPRHADDPIGVGTARRTGGAG